MINKLKQHLPKSNDADRKAWAQEIVHDQVVLEELIPLIHDKKSIASRFMWLLSDVGELQPQKLLEILPHILELSKQNIDLNFPHSLSRYWFIAGVPEQNEVEAIELLFHWLNSPKSNVMLKSTSMMVLDGLVKKHPDLKNEFKSILENQLDRNTDSFKKRALKIYRAL